MYWIERHIFIPEHQSSETATHEDASLTESVWSWCLHPSIQTYMTLVSSLVLTNKWTLFPVKLTIHTQWLIFEVLMLSYLAIEILRKPMFCLMFVLSAYVRPVSRVSARGLSRRIVPSCLLQWVCYCTVKVDHDHRTRTVKRLPRYIQWRLLEHQRPLHFCSFSMAHLLISFWHGR